MGILLFLLFILMPLAELYVIIQVGGAIGVLPTLALMVASALIGAALLRAQGRLAWQRFNEAMAVGRVPAREVFDGGMIIFGGALLLTPGFITDALGIFLLIPPGRLLLRNLTRRAAARTPSGRPVFFVYDRIGRREWRSPPGDGPTRRPGPGAGGGPARGYDFEGSAREIPDEDSGLPPGERSEA